MTRAPFSLEPSATHASAAPEAVEFLPGHREADAVGDGDEAVTVLNKALASGDAATVMDTLGGIARDRGMSQVARDTGLARESLYRSLDAGGNPEFATILKVLSSIGLHLEAKLGTGRALHIAGKT